MDEATIRWVYLYLLEKIKYGNAVLRIRKGGRISIGCPDKFFDRLCISCPVSKDCDTFYRMSEERRTKIFKELIRRKIIPYALYMKIEHE